jgi:hypothetical protein
MSTENQIIERFESEVPQGGGYGNFRILAYNAV